VITGLLSRLKGSFGYYRALLVVYLRSGGDGATAAMHTLRAEHLRGMRPEVQKL